MAIAGHAQENNLDQGLSSETWQLAWQQLMTAMYSDANIELTKSIERFSKDSEPDPRCLYPARWRLLKQRWPARKPPRCPALEMWKLRLEAEEITLVYAAQYISNPSSAMGHTFLKFTDLSHEPYLHQTLGFAAQVDENINAFSYVTKGLTGGFAGIFPAGPYYEKVHEYNNMEQRDVWEFTLSLNQVEREYLAEILWEMKFAEKIPYFFAGRNCSYQILLALQASRPNTRLSADFPLHVVPIETVKTLANAGMIANAKYRPSIRKRLLARYHSLGETEKRTFLTTVNAPNAAPNGSAEIGAGGFEQKTLDTVLDYLAMVRHRNRGELSASHKALERRSLLRRDELGQGHDPMIEAPPSPLTSHKPMRFDFGLSEGTSLERSLNFKFKPGAHGLMDKDVGYLSHSAFEFFQLNVDYFPESARWQPREFIIEDIAVSNPLDMLDPQPSFRMRAELVKEYGLSCRDCNMFRVYGAIGGTWEVFSSLLLQTMFKSELEVSEAFKRRVRFSPGLDLNILYSFAHRAKLTMGSGFSEELIEQAKLQRLQYHAELRIFDALPRLHIGGRLQHETLLGTNVTALEVSFLASFEL